MSDDYAIDDFTTDEKGNKFLKYQQFTFTKATIDHDDNGNTIEYKGASPTSGFVKIYVNGEIALAISNNKYVACKAAESDTIIVGSRANGDACAINDDGEVVDGPTINQGEWQNQINKMQESINRLTEENNALKVSDANQNAKIDSITTGSSNQKEELDSIKSNITNLNTELEDIKKVNVTQSSDITVLQTSYTNLNKSISTYGTDIESIKSKNTNQDASITSLQTAVENIKKNLDSVGTANTILDKAYPVGSIYVSTSSTNPSALFGGTWEVYGAGRTLVGKSTSLTAGATGGSNSITLSESQMPSHSHSVTATGSVSSTFTGNQATTSSNGSHTHTFTGSSVTTSSAGSHSHTFTGTSRTTSSAGSHSHGWLSEPTHLAWTGTGSDGTGVGIGGGDYRSTATAGAHTHTFTPSGSISSGGSHTHTVTAAGSNSSAGAHTHTLTPTGSVSSTFTGTKATTSSSGSGSSIDIRNPYVVVYMWKRTA